MLALVSQDDKPVAQRLDVQHVFALHLRAEVVHLRHYLVGNFGTAAFDDPVKIVHVGDEPAETEVFYQQSR